MDDFKLMPSPSRREAPNGRLMYFSDLEGKTIRKIIEYPSGLRGDLADVVIVCDDNTWLPVYASPDGSDNATVEILSPYSHYRQADITDLLHPRELLDAELVNHEQYLMLERQMEAKKAESNAKRAAALRAEAEKLDSQKGQP